MVKKMLAIVVVCLAGGAWLYLDCWSKHEQGSAKQTRIEIEKARAEAQRRALGKVSFESQLLTDLNICKAAADKGKKDFMDLIPKAVTNRRGPYVIPQAVEAEAVKLLEAAKMECQQLYDARIKAGQ
jgi:hypothetical protein